MSHDLSKRIQNRLDKLGKNPSGVALEAGLGRSSVRDILLGRAANPRLDTLQKLTGPLQCTLDYLTGQSDNPQASASNSHLWWMDIEVEPDPYLAETGVFRPIQPFSAVSNFPPAEPEIQKGHIKLKDPRIPSWGVILYLAGDNTMEDIHIIKGDILTVAHEPLGGHIPLTDGLIVAVQRTIIDPKIEEVSIRQVEVGPDFVRLISRSKDGPAPIIINEQSLASVTPMMPNAYCENSILVEILGIVVRVVRDMLISEEALYDISNNKD